MSFIERQPQESILDNTRKINGQTSNKNSILCKDKYNG